MPYTPHDEVSLTCFTKDFDKYSFGHLKSDLIAGLSVAMLTVPQAMAYSLVAGLPVSCGLLSAIFSALIVACFGSSRHLVVGPSNAIAILIQAGISEILFTYYRDISEPDRMELSLQILTQILLVVGAIQLIAAFFKLGRLTHFVSHTVIVGYVTGIALALVINQLFPLLGISLPEKLSSLYERGIYIATHLHLAHIPTAVIGVGCVALLLLLKRYSGKVPAGAVMLGIVALAAYFLDLSVNYLNNAENPWIEGAAIEKFLAPIAQVGETRGDGLIPLFDWPYFNLSILNNVFPVAFAIALLSVMEALSASKAIAANSGQRLSINQEMFALGMGNLFSSLITAMPVSGSAARSALNYENGAKTRLAAIFNSIFVALILLVFGFLIRHIPVAAFAALLVVSAASIVNFKQLLLCFKATSSDASVLILTILACLFLSLDIAFYMGVVMSISLYLKKAAVPQMVEFTVDEGGVLHTIDPHHLGSRKIRFIKVEGELFFGAADLFQSALKAFAEDDTTTQVLILQLKNARDIDATACLALQHLHDFLRSSGRYLIACGLTDPIWDVLSDSGIVDSIGKANLFIFDERHPQLSVQKAFNRAHELIHSTETLSVKPEAAASEDLDPLDAAMRPAAELMLHPAKE